MGYQCPPPGDCPNPEIELRSLSLQADSLPAELSCTIYLIYFLLTQLVIWKLYFPLSLSSSLLKTKLTSNPDHMIGWIPVWRKGELLTLGIVGSNVCVLLVHKWRIYFNSSTCLFEPYLLSDHVQKGRWKDDFLAYIFFSCLYLDCKLWISEVLFINQDLKASGLASNLEEQQSVDTVLSLASSASNLGFFLISFYLWITYKLT